MSQRQYQQKWKDDIRAAWAAGHRNVLGVLPTGGGKSYSIGELVNEHQGAVAVIAHRQELVGQLSMALAKNGVEHRIIAPSKVQKFIMAEQLQELGTTAVRSNARVAVIGVDTMVRRHREHASWLATVTLWVTDECHHILRTNKWGKVCDFMPNAIGLGVTATPCRADGAGLGRSAKGVMDFMIEGPSMRELIEEGFLTDYRIFAPPSDVVYDEVNVGKSGEYVQKQLKTAVRESHMIGDVVKHYKRIAPGKLGITFATDVETATDIAVQFNIAGVPAEVVSAKTPDRLRASIIKRFRNREIMQLVNVDLFGEGFDLPAIEVVSMARRTMSYSLYCQQFGRALRPLEGKEHAIIIDHAGNVKLHGLPDKDREWTLENTGNGPQMKDPDDEIPLRYCAECTQPYEIIHKACPWCGHVMVPADRSKPEYVDGDLHELSPEALALMRGEVARVDQDPNEVARRMQYAGASDIAVASALKNNKARQLHQSALRTSIAYFAHIQNGRGVAQNESYRRFYVTFGIDVLSAQALGKPQAIELAGKINLWIGRNAA